MAELETLAADYESLAKDASDLGDNKAAEHFREVAAALRTNERGIARLRILSAALNQARRALQ